MQVDIESIAKKTAEYAGMMSGYLQARNVDEILQDANRLIRRFPEHSLVAAAAAALLRELRFEEALMLLYRL